MEQHREAEASRCARHEPQTTEDRTVPWLTFLASGFTYLRMMIPFSEFSRNEEDQLHPVASSRRTRGMPWNS